MVNTPFYEREYFLWTNYLMKNYNEFFEYIDRKDFYDDYMSSLKEDENVADKNQNANSTKQENNMQQPVVQRTIDNIILPSVGQLTQQELKAFTSSTLNTIIKSFKKALNEYGVTVKNFKLQGQNGIQPEKIKNDYVDLNTLFKLPQQNIQTNNSVKTNSSGVVNK